MQLARWHSILVAAMCSAGCAVVSTIKQDWAPDFESQTNQVWTEDGMYLVKGRAGALFLSPPPLDLKSYRGVFLEEIRVSSKNPSRGLRPNEETRLKGYFTRRLADVFEDYGLPLVDEAGADVLRVRLSVKDVAIDRTAPSHHGQVVAGESRDRISIVLEVREPVSNTRKLLYGDSRGLPFGTYSGTDAVSLRRVEDAFYDFSIDMRRRLHQVQRGEFPPPPRAAPEGHAPTDLARV